MELTQEQWDLLRLRRSQEDMERVIAALEIDGSLSVPATPAPLDEDGEEIERAAPVFDVNPVTAAAADEAAAAENGNPNGGEKLPGTHEALDALAAERGIDLGDASTVAEKQDAIRAAS